MKKAVYITAALLILFGVAFICNYLLIKTGIDVTFEANRQQTADANADRYEFIIGNEGRRLVAGYIPNGFYDLDNKVVQFTINFKDGTKEIRNIKIGKPNDSNIPSDKYYYLLFSGKSYPCRNIKSLDVCGDIHSEKLELNLYLER